MFRSSIGEKMQTLRTKGERLKCRADDIIIELEYAEFRLQKKRKREVENWLGNVEKKRNELQNLEQDVEQQRGALSGLLSGFGKRVENMIKEMDELVEQGKFSGGLLLDVHESRGQPFLTTKLVGEAFQNNLQKIFEFLKKDDVLSIGIYGMGSVGKTALASHIHNLLLEKSNNIFHHVYWVTVSHDFSIHKLQDMIATVLKQDLEDKHDERKRAAELSRALLQRNKCVLILDDVWNHFRLEDVGICLKVNGCKLMLTTRFFNVCCRMACDEKIKVESLPEKETWDLFKKTLGHGVALSPDIEKVAFSIAKRCAGLPLGIITMAGSMRGVNDIHEWRNVLEELENRTTEQRDMQDKVFPILKLSYDRLKDAKLRHCFLYCALYPEDMKISRWELIRFFTLEGIIDRKKSNQAKFDMGHTLLNKLENACLLEGYEGDLGGRYVKMHDLTREMALEITKVSPRFMVKSGWQFSENLDENEWMEDLEKVSLMHSKIKIPEGMSPRCPKLSTLLFSGADFLMEIPHSFFVHMRALRVLDLSSTGGIKELPNSISNLENLTALFLQSCVNLEYVPPLGNLRALQVLDLSETCIEEVPQGMEMLVNLHCLYILSMVTNVVLPTGILPRLSCLQVLRLDVDTIVVRREEVEELKLLEDLFCRYDVCNFKQFVQSQCFKQLSMCKIIICDDGYVSDEEPGWYLSIKEDKRVSINDFSVMGEEGEVDRALLPHDIQYLELSKCHDVHILCNGSLLFKDLKVCEIKDCDGIEYIVRWFSSNEIEVEEDSGEKSPCAPLHSLEILKLKCLSNLSALSKWGRQGGERVMAPLPAGTFFNLKDLEIKNCHKIKKLFQPGLLQHLKNLEQICASDCYGMEEIMAEDDEEMGACSSNATIFSLPKLKTFELIHIPLLKSICRGVMACDSIERITLFNCRQLKRVQFSLPLINGQPSPPHALQLILIDKDGLGWWESLEWDHPNGKNVLQPFVEYRNKPNKWWRPNEEDPRVDNARACVGI